MIVHREMSLRHQQKASAMNVHRKVSLRHQRACDAHGWARADGWRGVSRSGQIMEVSAATQASTETQSGETSPKSKSVCGWYDRVGEAVEE